MKRADRPDDATDRPDFHDLREGTDYLASLQDHAAWERLMAEIRAGKARRQTPGPACRQEAA